jgi:hypothetical protein
VEPVGFTGQLIALVANGMKLESVLTSCFEMIVDADPRQPEVFGKVFPEMNAPLARRKARSSCVSRSMALIPVESNVHPGRLVDCGPG